MVVKKAPRNRKTAAAQLARTVRAGKGRQARTSDVGQHIKRDPATGRILIDGLIERQIVELGPKIHPIEVAASPKHLTMDQINRLVAAMQVR